MSKDAWWGTVELGIGEALDRRIGEIALRVERGAREWRLTTARAAPHGEPTLLRFAQGETGGPLRISPLVADRAVVTAPLTPLFVVPGGRVTLYVSTPLFYRIEVGEPPCRLHEAFIVAPGETWFGPSTREGEVCYASRTSARLELAEVPARPERAITAVTIHNPLDTVLPIERLGIPAPQLTLYADAEQRLWTQDVAVHNRKEAYLADLDLDRRPPAAAPEPVVVGEPRESGADRRLFRAFGAIFD